MMHCKRIFLIVLDSFGIGAAPDAELFGDAGSNTYASVRRSAKLHIPNLISMGLGNIDGVEGEATSLPTAAYGRLRERSAGKDTVTGHRELCGITASRPMPTYPDGFPRDLLKKIEKASGIGTLCNKPYSGTDVIRDYGREHIESGKMIVYTSADSVFQATAHSDIYPLDKLYEYCETARSILTGEHAVGRVIARPFSGEYPNYVRVAGRHDYAVPPSSRTLLDEIKDAGLDCISVGKIYDIFAGCGMTESHPTSSNAEGMAILRRLIATDFTGLCFVNLVDFDSKYGHRNDVDGYAEALSEFDLELGHILSDMLSDDILMITADHGCDPAFPGTDHTREYIPLLVYGDMIKSHDLGTRDAFSDVGRTIADMLAVEYRGDGESFADILMKEGYRR